MAFVLSPRSDSGVLRKEVIYLLAAPRHISAESRSVPSISKIAPLIFIIITRLSAKDTNGVMKIPDGLSLLSVSCYSFPAILAYYTARGGE